MMHGLVQIRVWALFDKPANLNIPAELVERQALAQCSHHKVFYRVPA